MSPRLFRFLLVMVFLLQVAGLLAEPLATRTLPADLQWFAERAAPRTLGMPEVLAAAGAAAFVIAALVALAGLYRLLGWARPLAVVLTVVSLAVTPLFGPTVQAPIITVLRDLSAITWGLILAASFWSPVASHFGAPRGTGVDSTSATEG